MGSITTTKNNNIKYTCDVCKKSPRDGRFRRRWQWKTEKGYQNHHCWKDIEIERKEFLKKQEEAIKKQEEEYRLATEEFKKVAKYSIGQSIYYVSWEVTGPTHELRGERLVRVRYEEERKYKVYNGIVTEVRLGGYIVNNVFVSERSIYIDKDEALDKVQESQNIYDSYLQDCSRYR